MHCAGLCSTVSKHGPEKPTKHPVIRVTEQHDGKSMGFGPVGAGVGVVVADEMNRGGWLQILYIVLIYYFLNQINVQPLKII